MPTPSLPKTRSFIWTGNALKMLDQRVLPHRVHWITYRTWEGVAEGIQQMVVRGAPAIGCVAAYGIVLAAKQKKFKSVQEQIRFLEKASAGLLAARPTAVNLRWALERMRGLWNGAPVHMCTSTLELTKRLEQEAIRIEQEDRAGNKVMGIYGARLFKKNASIMTICNTGSLATAGLGTAFGVLWTCHHLGKLKKVIACETRPYLQGARLTAYELN